MSMRPTRFTLPANLLRGLLLPFSFLLFPFASPVCRAQQSGDNPLYGNPRGPIAVRDARPYNLLFLQFTPETADVLPPRANTYNLHLEISNNLLAPDANGQARVREDNEYQRLLFTWKRGLGREMELAVSVPLQWRDGGILDGILSGYHSLFGFQGNGPDDPTGRDFFRKYQSTLLLTNAQGQTVINQGNAFGLGETNVTIKRGLIRQTGRSALAARLGVKLPTGNATLLLGSGNVDAGLSVDGRYSLGRDIVVYANVGGALLGHASRVPGAQANTLQTLVALEYRANNRDSFVLQTDGNTRVVRTGVRFADGWQSTATFGYHRVLDRHHLLTLSFSENGDIHNYHLPAFSNLGPDFSVSAGVQWR